MSIDTREYPHYNYPVNSTKYYACVFAQAEQFIHDIIDGTLSGFDVSALFQNSRDYVSNIRIYPFNINKIYSVSVTPESTFMLGKKALTSSDYQFYSTGLSSIPNKKWFSFTLTRYFNNFLDFNPYTQIKLYVPLFSTIDLPLEQCYGNTIDGYLSIDLKTGMGTLSLFNHSTGLMIYTETKQIGIELPMGSSNEEEQQRNRILQTITVTGSVIGTIVGAYMGNPLITAGSVGMLTKNIANSLQNEVDRFSSHSGVNGTVSTYMNSKEILLIFERPKNVRYPNYSLKGGVCNKNLSLDTVNGYTEIGEIHFNPQNTVIYDNEESEIIELLRTGVIL